MRQRCSHLMRETPLASGVALPYPLTRGEFRDKPASSIRTTASKHATIKCCCPSVLAVLRFADLPQQGSVFTRARPLAIGAVYE